LAQAELLRLLKSWVSNARDFFVCFDFTRKEFGPIGNWNWMYAKSCMGLWADLDFRVIKLLSLKKKSKTYVFWDMGISFHYLCISIVSNVFHRYEIVCINETYNGLVWAKNVPKTAIFVYNYTIEDVSLCFYKISKVFPRWYIISLLFLKEGKLTYIN